MAKAASDWQTGPPPLAVEIELVTRDGKALTGSLSFIGAYSSGGVKRGQYMLRHERGIFEVEKWRRV